MSGILGLTRADVPLDFYDDRRVRRLKRDYRDTAASDLHVYLSVYLDSFRENERVSSAELAPGYDLEPLIEVGLLERDGRMVQEDWDDNFGPVADRVMRRRRASMFGGLKNHMSDDQANAEADVRASEAWRTFGLTVTPTFFKLRTRPKDSSHDSTPTNQPSIQPTRMDGWIDAPTGSPEGDPPPRIFTEEAKEELFGDDALPVGIRALRASREGTT